MPAVVDISNSGSRKKTPGKPKPPAGPKPAVLIGLGVAVVFAISFAVWFLVFHNGADSKTATPYGPPQTRTPGGANGGAAGGVGSKGIKVAPGLPGG